MDDSIMHVPDLGAVIIDYPDGCLVHLVDCHLLHQFPPHTLVIAKAAREKSMIFLRNMAPNSDGIQSVQPRFLAAFPASVSQYLVIADHEDVRDKLFVTFVLFGVASIQVQNMGSAGNDRQVFLNFETEALKHVQLFEKFPFKTKHSFFCCHTFICLSSVALNSDDNPGPFASKICSFMFTGYSTLTSQGCIHLPL